MKINPAMLRSAGAVGGPGSAQDAKLSLDGSSGTKSASEGFGAMLERAVDSTNQVQLKADSHIEAFVGGADIAPHELMISISEADTTLRLFTGVVSRVIEAYREISRIDV